MTPRYRCPWCGSFSNNNASAVRSHVLERHRTALVIGLGFIEYSDITDKEIAP